MRFRVVGNPTNLNSAICNLESAISVPLPPRCPRRHDFIHAGVSDGLAKVLVHVPGHEEQGFVYRSFAAEELDL